MARIIPGPTSVSNATPQNVATSAGAGSSELASRADHVHALADSVVQTGKIADGAVTTLKIADLNVTTAKIAADNVTMPKLAAIVRTFILAGV